MRSRAGWAPDTVPPVARKKHPPISVHDRRTIGATLREIRRAAGSYERGGLVPSLPQFLELVEFYVLQAPLPPAPGSAAKSETDLRALGIAAVTRALALPAYHVAQAHDLIARMQPELGRRS